MVHTIIADRLKQLHPAFTGDIECQVQVRAHGEVVPCSAHIEGDTMTLTLKQPLSGVARGQASVIYLRDPEGDIVLGSGTICGTVH